MNPWPGIAVVLAALGALIGGVKLLEARLALHPELARKGVHAGMGVVCLSFPWIFHENWPVWLLAVLAVVSLAAVRWIPVLRRGVGSVLGGVGRRSFGEFYFPVAVAIVFSLARGNLLLFFIPVLTLTVADSVGALIGVRYGKLPYRTDEGFKSVEGSAAFFFAAFLSCHIPLLLSGNIGRPETLLIALTAGFIVMLLEAIAWRGQDNLIIPLGMFLLLKLYMPLGIPALVIRLVVILALVTLVVASRKRTTLSDSAVLAGALAGYIIWAFGGWLWLAGPVLLFLIYVSLPFFPVQERPVQNLRAVTRVLAGGFLWLLVGAMGHRREALALFLLCMAAHTGNIVTARLRVVKVHMPIFQVMLVSWVMTSMLFGILMNIACLVVPLPMGYVAFVPLVVAVSISVFVPSWPVAHHPGNAGRVWASETLVAIAASLIGFFLIQRS